MGKLATAGGQFGGRSIKAGVVRVPVQHLYSVSGKLFFRISTYLGLWALLHLVIRRTLHLPGRILGLESVIDPDVQIAWFLRVPLAGQYPRHRLAVLHR